MFTRTSLLRMIAVLFAVLLLTACGGGGGGAGNTGGGNNCNWDQAKWDGFHWC